jgi:hypothetical protein
LASLLLYCHLLTLSPLDCHLMKQLQPQLTYTSLGWGPGQQLQPNWTFLESRGLYFDPKWYLSSLFLKVIFSPLSLHVVFWLLLCHFCLSSSLFYIYFTLSLPIFSFSLPLLLFLSPFLIHLQHFPSFSLPLLIFSPQMTSAEIAPPPGAGVFSKIWPLLET